MKNAFLALREEEVAEFRTTRDERVLRQVRGRLHSAEMIGELVQLFLPRMADTLATLAGGEPLLDDADKFNVITEEKDEFSFYYDIDDDDAPSPSGPTAPDGIIR